VSGWRNIFFEDGHPAYEYFHEDNKTYTVQIWDENNYEPLLKNGNGLIISGDGDNLINHTTYKDSICVESYHIRTNKKDTVYTICDTYVSYKGGLEKMYQKIKNRTNYSLNAWQRGHTGTVYVECIIDKDGIPTEIRVVEKVFYEFDLEAIKVVESLKKWIVGRHKGKPVKCLIVLPIEFY
jgi:protein TonB